MVPQLNMRFLFLFGLLFSQLYNQLYCYTEFFKVNYSIYCELKQHISKLRAVFIIKLCAQLVNFLQENAVQCLNNKIVYGPQMLSQTYIFFESTVIIMIPNRVVYHIMLLQFHQPTFVADKTLLPHWWRSSCY